MIRFCLLLILFQGFAWASPQEEASLILEQGIALQKTEERMDFFSRQFLGLPYGDGGPLGEGENARYDQDPLYRFDTFDCTTFVETIISLALAHEVNEFERLMNEIRYHHGEIDYLTRNHFPSLQWIPYNIENGFLSDITFEIAPKNQIKEAEALIHLPNWLKSIKINEIKVPLASDEEKAERLEELHGKAALFSPQVATLNYIPINYLLDHPEQLDLIPHASVVNFVRPNWDLTSSIGTHMNVSHQGLLFWKEKILFLRHASTSAPKTVSELPFIDYLKKFRDHPTLRGVHFMRVN